MNDLDTNAVAMYAAYTAGATMSEIAARFGMSTASVYNVFKRNGYATDGRRGGVRTRADKQRLLDYIRDYRATRNIAPNYSEMALALGRKPSQRGNVGAIVRRLIDEGWLMMTVPGNPNSLVLCDPAPRERYYEPQGE